MLHAAWYPTRLYKYYVKGVKRNKIIINEYLRLHLRLLFVMLEVLKALYTQMNNRIVNLKQNLIEIISNRLKNPFLIIHNKITPESRRYSTMLQCSFFSKADIFVTIMTIVRYLSKNYYNLHQKEKKNKNKMEEILCIEDFSLFPFSGEIY